jgi:hypothetical protein
MVFVGCGMHVVPSTEGHVLSTITVLELPLLVEELFRDPPNIVSVVNKGRPGNPNTITALFP